MNWYKKAKVPIDFDKLIAVIASLGGFPFGGNCGIFSFGLGKFLKENGINSSLVFFSNTDNFNDFIDSEVSLYHVALKLSDGRILDGDGFTSLQGIVDNMVFPEYNDASPYVDFYALDDNSLKAIRFQTSYYGDWQTFYNEIKNRYNSEVKTEYDNNLFKEKDEDD